MVKFAALLVSVFSITFGWTLNMGFETSGAPFGTSDSTYAEDGHKSCKVHCTGGGSFFGGTKGFDSSVAYGKEVWIRIFYYFPTNFSFGNGGGGDAWGYTKWIRLETNMLSGETYGRRTTLQVGQQDGSSAPLYVTQEWTNAQTNIHFGAGGDSIQKGKWTEIQWYVLFDTGTQTGKMRVWKDGKFLGEFTGQTMAESSRKIVEMVIGDYWNGGIPQTQDFWIDNLEVTTDVPSGRDSLGNPIIGGPAATIRPSAANFNATNGNGLNYNPYSYDLLGRRMGGEFGEMREGVYLGPMYRHDKRTFVTMCVIR